MGGAACSALIMIMSATPLALLALAIAGAYVLRPCMQTLVHFQKRQQWLLFNIRTWFSYILPSAGISATPSGLTPSPAVFSIAETTSTNSVNTIIGQLECKDGEINSVEFSIADDVPFHLEHIGMSNSASLVRTTELDYDSGPSVYQFPVTCSDSSGSVTDNITVTILPENDNYPTFDIRGTPIIILETTATGTVLASQDSGGAHIVASDGDRGEDGVLRFSFLSPTIETVHFDINETDGTISLKKPFDRDTDATSSISLNVVACDGSRETDTCPVVNVPIFIVPANEFDPQFSLPSYNTSEVFYYEGEYSELVIATVQCSDSDVDVGTFEGIQLMNTSLPLVLVAVEEGQVNVVLNGSLDLEMIRETEVKVHLLCTDSGEPARQDTATITLHIQGIDDNLPEFSDDTYNVFVDESHPVDTEVLAVQCRDADYGLGGLEGLEMMNACRDVATTFHIDADSGIITLTHSLDYDTDTQSYEFKVLCRDTAGNEAVAGVTITVLGVDDEPVTFTRSQYNFTVSRLGTAPGVVVGQVQTQDRDLGIQPNTTYSIEDNPHFDINSDGQVLLKEFLFRLEGGHFRLNVTASDGVNGDATALVAVTVEGPLSLLEIVIILVGVLVLTLIVVVSICCYFVIKRMRKK